MVSPRPSMAGESGPASAVPSTPRALLRSLQPMLEAAGIPDARHELMRLLSHLRGEPIARLLAHLDDSMPPDTGGAEADALTAMARRRANREPLAYITGTVDFAGLTLAVGPGVLVPRPDSECVVETAVALVMGGEAAPVKNRPDAGEPLRLLDTCTGSGAIGIAIARLLKDAGIPVALHLLDASPEALAYARDNAARWCADLPHELERGDLFPAKPVAFDLVTINPPYIADAVLPGLMPEVSRFEPAEALAAGADGLDVYRRIVAQADAFLRPGGWLLLEHGYDQADAVAALIRTNPAFAEPMLVTDYGGNPRVTSAQRVSS